MKTYQFPNSNKNYSDTEPTASPLLNQLLSARGITKLKKKIFLIQIRNPTPLTGIVEWYEKGKRIE